MMYGAPFEGTQTMTVSSGPEGVLMAEGLSYLADSLHL
ncbi:MAG: hypothetical protein GW949_05900 [Spirochaetales bacterium]|nr:hypothetical protein [Spirochaetales bacterium]